MGCHLALLSIQLMYAFIAAQSRGGLVLYQMYDEATGRKAKTTRIGAAPGALDKKPKATAAGELTDCHAHLLSQLHVDDALT